MEATLNQHFGEVVKPQLFNGCELKKDSSESASFVEQMKAMWYRFRLEVRESAYSLKAKLIVEFAEQDGLVFLV